MTKNNAFPTKTNAFADATLASLNYVSKPIFKFISTLVVQWLCVSGRYNFTNIARYSNYSEQNIRNGFERGFDFLKFNHTLLQNHNCTEYVLAFDPSHINKSGKQTYGLGRFWSGKDQRTKVGLEIGCLAAIDVNNHTALHLQAVQTPSAQELKKTNKNLVTHYVSIIQNNITELLTLSKHLAVDSYFMKKDFINPMLDMGLHVITKMRTDANLQYIFSGKQKEGRGRKKTFDGKVDLKKIDKRRFKKISTEEDGIEFYTAKLHCVALKKIVRVVYILETKTQNYSILLCTDIDFVPEKIVQYYRLRFQIEFLIRDAKQHTGLEDCQARSKNKLDFHFNMALTVVSLEKIKHYSLPKNNEKSFSMLSAKRFAHNGFIANFIFSKLDIDPSCKKIKQLYKDALKIGSLAA